MIWFKSILPDTKYWMLVSSLRDSLLTTRKPQRNCWDLLMWTILSTSLATPRYSEKIFRGKSCLQSIRWTIFNNYYSWWSGVLQSWSAGNSGGDERWEIGWAGHNDTGSLQRLPHETRVCQDDGEEVMCPFIFFRFSSHFLKMGFVKLIQKYFCYILRKSIKTSSQ